MHFARRHCSAQLHAHTTSYSVSWTSDGSIAAAWSNPSLVCGPFRPKLATKPTCPTAAVENTWPFIFLSLMNANLPLSSLICSTASARKPGASPSRSTTVNTSPQNTSADTCGNETRTSRPEPSSRPVTGRWNPLSLPVVTYSSSGGSGSGTSTSCSPVPFRLSSLLSPAAAARSSA